MVLRLTSILLRVDQDRTTAEEELFAGTNNGCVARCSCDIPLLHSEKSCSCGMSVRLCLDGWRQDLGGGLKMARDEGASCCACPSSEARQSLQSIDHHAVLHDALDICLPLLRVALEKEHNSLYSCSSPELLHNLGGENHKWSGGLSVLLVVPRSFTKGVRNN